MALTCGSRAPLSPLVGCGLIHVIHALVRSPPTPLLPPQVSGLQADMQKALSYRKSAVELRTASKVRVRRVRYF